MKSRWLSRVIILLFAIVIVGCGVVFIDLFRLLWATDVVLPTQTNNVATEVVTTTNNLVSSDTNTSGGISFRGKVQSGWGESNNE